MSHDPEREPDDVAAARWHRVEALVIGALERTADERTAFLARECGSDAALRSEVSALLAAHEHSGLLDRPVVHFAQTDSAALETALAPGTMVSHYQLHERLGSGGMGIVYRAHDLRLDRAVALKFLPAALSEDLGAKRRFLIEARAAAALEHSNVCTVHEIGETEGGQLFIAMAYVDGQSLRRVMERGPLPLEQAIDIARQVAGGLRAAHDRGIVHRDVKPANIMVGRDGVVKLVDFGIAKLAGLTLTAAGATPGTAAYMSPEQTRGDAVDHRTDLWALGVVLYEMLAGRRPFAGDNDAVVLHSIANTAPPSIRSVRPDVPADLAALIESALEKNPERRIGSALEMREALGDTSEHAERYLTRAASREPRWTHSRGAWLAAGLALSAVLVVGAYVWTRQTPAAPAETLRLSVSAPGNVTPQLSATVSPDGLQVAFVATDSSGQSRLWVRTLDQLQPRALSGTERAAHPFWSPDGRSLGFIADNQIKRVELSGGAVQTLADTVVRYGAAWGPDGTILFARRFGELASVPASGGAVKTVLRADSAKGQRGLLWPRFLPDGRHFIFFASSTRSEHQGIYVGSFDRADSKLVLRSDYRAWYAPPGYLVFLRGESLVAQPFDPDRLEVHGAPVVVADGVWSARPAAQASFSTSETGVLAYVNASLWDGELAWFDRGGRILGTAGPPVRHEGLTPQISRDGRRIAVARGELGRQDIWVIGTSGENATRLTFTPHADGLPVWAFDSRRVMFTSGGRLIVRDVESGAEEIVLENVPGRLLDWSRDGRVAVFERSAAHTHLWMAVLEGDRTPVPYLETSYNAAQAQLSPDGRWIAYTSNESGRDEVYVQSFPVSGRKRQVSNAGGAMPRWRADGMELFYLAGNQFLTAVPIVDHASLALGRATPLFRTRLVVEGSESQGIPTRYDVAPDGQRFLVRYPPTDPGPPITVVINWVNALRRPLGSPRSIQ